MFARAWKSFLILLILSSVARCESDNQLSQTIRPTTDEETQQRAALDVIRRLIADKVDNVAIKINFNLPGNYFKVRESPRQEKESQ